MEINFKLFYTFGGNLVTWRKKNPSAETEFWVMEQGFWELLWRKLY